MKEGKRQLRETDKEGISGRVQLRKQNSLYVFQTERIYHGDWVTQQTEELRSHRRGGRGSARFRSSRRPLSPRGWRNNGKRLCYW